MVIPTSIGSVHVHRLILWRRTAASLILASYTLTTTGCTSWKNQGTDVAAVITPSPSPALPRGGGDAPSSGYPGLGTPQPVSAPTLDTVRKVRITTKSQGPTELRNPRVANDSLYGQEKKNGPESAFALADILAVETHGVSAVKTTVLVVGVLAASLVAVVGGFVVTGCDPVYGC